MVKMNFIKQLRDLWLKTVTQIDRLIICLKNSIILTDVYAARYMKYRGLRK